MLNLLTVYPLFLPSVGPMEMGVIFLVVLILFGPGKLPEVFRALGEGVHQFKEASKGVTDTTHQMISATSIPPTTTMPLPQVNTPAIGEEASPTVSNLSQTETNHSI